MPVNGPYPAYQERNDQKGRFLLSFDQLRSVDQFVILQGTTLQICKGTTCL